MGRKPNPPHLSLLMGGEPSKTNTDTPTPAAKEPIAPSWLTVEARMVWNDVTDELREMGMLHRADGNELLSYVLLVVDTLKVGFTIRREGFMVAAMEGHPLRVHPLLATYDRMLRTQHRMATAFGLNPAGRCSLHLDRMARPEAPADDLRSHLAAM